MERSIKSAKYYEVTDAGCRCRLCPHMCLIAAGRKGLCLCRVTYGSDLFAEGYGHVTSLALDPIEKKPLYMFHPGSVILSVGSYGCNMACLFCQNHSISGGDPGSRYIPPDELVRLAAGAAEAEGNIGVAFTYNEPLINIEYLLDTAPLIKKAGLAVVLVTNGMINKEPLCDLLPYIDAMNIDLKAFDDNFYKRHGGDLGTVKHTIERSASACHVEVTTLIIPGENDREDDMKEEALWLADISSDIPLHITRFFPRHKMGDREPTPPKTLFRLKQIAENHLNHVFVGNV